MSPVKILDTNKKDKKILGWPRSSLEDLKKGGECLWDGGNLSAEKADVKDTRLDCVLSVHPIRAAF